MLGLLVWCKYLDVDLEVVWKTVESDLPLLKELIQNL